MIVCDCRKHNSDHSKCGNATNLTACRCAPMPADSALMKLIGVLDAQLPNDAATYSVESLRWVLVQCDDHVRLEIIPMRCFFTFTDEGALIAGGNRYDYPGAISQTLAQDKCRVEGVRIPHLPATSDFERIRLMLDAQPPGEIMSARIDKGARVLVAPPARFDYEVDYKRDSDYLVIYVLSHQFGLMFDSKGTLMGAFNWKG